MMRDTVSKEKVDSNRVKHSALASGLHTHIYTYTLMNTYTHIQKFK